MAVPEYDDFATWKRNIEHRLRDLFTMAATRPKLNVVKGGALQVLDDDGVVIATIGRQDDGSVGVRAYYPGGAPAFFTGTLADGRRETRGYRDDGTMALRVGGVAGQPQFVALMDRQGNVVASDDTVSGQGLGTPWLSMPLPVDVDSARWPRTQSTTFATIARSWPFKQHPRLSIFGYAACDASTTGEVRVMAGTSQIGPTFSVGAGTGINLQAVGDIPGSYAQQYELRIEARRLSGSGNVYATLVRAEAMQS